MTKTSLILAAAVWAAGLAAAHAVPLPPERPAPAELLVKVQDMASDSSTTVVKKRGLLGSRTTMTHARSGPDSTGVVVHRRGKSGDCRTVTVHKEDGMGNSVTKRKATC